MSTLYLCGAGNPEGVRLALRVNARERRWDRLVVLDDDPVQRGREILGVPVAGPFTLLGDADPSRDAVANLVARTTERRFAARRKIAAYGLPFAALVDPEVDLTGAVVEGDVTIYRYATIGAEATVAQGCVVFMGAVIGHGARLGPGCIVAGNAVINARNVLGAGVYVGSNAAILPDLAVGEGATIGAGSVAMMTVPPGRTVIGVPGRILALTQEPAPAAPRPQPAVPVPLG